MSSWKADFVRSFGFLIVDVSCAFVCKLEFKVISDVRIALVLLRIDSLRTDFLYACSDSWIRLSA
jgi:hypothetical protein